MDYIVNIIIAAFSRKLSVFLLLSPHLRQIALFILHYWQKVLPISNANFTSQTNKLPILHIRQKKLAFLHLRQNTLPILYLNQNALSILHLRQNVLLILNLKQNALPVLDGKQNLSSRKVW